MNRYLKITLVALSIFVLPFVYLAYSLAGPRYEWWPAVAAPFVIVLCLPLAVFSKDRRQKVWWRDWLVHAAHLCMAVTTYLAVFTFLRDVILWVGFDRPDNRWVFASTVLAVIVGNLIASRGPWIKRVEVPIAELPPALDQFRIVQVSDLHVGPTIGRRYVERVVRLANGCKPDLVAMTGDIADADVTRTEAATAPLAELTPKGRVFYVPGNHEYYWQIQPWLERFRNLNFTVLLNEGVTFPIASGTDFFVAGITDPAAAQFGQPAPDLARAASGQGKASFKLLLAHRPDLAHEADQLKFDLQLSGHTHGGQFFPWTLAIRFFHEFYSGLRRAGRMWIYVSVGTGSWGPLVRLGTVPEVTLVTLKRAK